jgi:hypothetical protein
VQAITRAAAAFSLSSTREALLFRFIPPERTEPHRLRSVAKLALWLVLVAVLVGLCWWQRPAPRAVSATTTFEKQPTVAVSAPAERTRAVPADRKPTVLEIPGLPSPALIEIVAANSAPGRILFLDFTLDASGLRLTGATGTAGRAKPTVPRSGFGFVQYEVLDRTDQLTAAGSVEDPTRRRVEHPAASNDGRIESTVLFSEAGPLSVRLPGESAPARIVLFRDKNPVAGGAAAGREVLGDFRLRSD